MPRLNHKKTRSGCQRCKARKVKCDEGRPKCAACSRHNVPCVYPQQGGRQVEQRSFSFSDASSNGPYPINTPPQPVSEPGVDHNIELRLMHEWTAYTCRTFSTAWEFWCYQAPTIALEFRFVMDAMLAMAALHASRRPPSRWISTEGRMLPISTPASHTVGRETDLADQDLWTDLRRKSVMDTIVNAYNEAGASEFLAEKQANEMLTLHRMYFDRAIEGYRKALNEEELSIDNIEAAFAASILVSFNALFTLSEGGDEGDSTLDPAFWLCLGRGSRFIIHRWQELVGDAWIANAGVYYGKPDLTDDKALFAPENARPFQKLLTFAQDFEAMTAEDREAYRLALLYIGGIYKGIVEGTDSPLATCRRLSSMPSRCTPRFVKLVEAQAPRAMVMIAHVFASMKLVDQNAVWFRGIAERQVPMIYDSLPNAWREMMVWPLAVARGEVEREPKETMVDDAATV